MRSLKQLGGHRRLGEAKRRSASQYSPSRRLRGDLRRLVKSSPARMLRPLETLGLQLRPHVLLAQRSERRHSRLFPRRAFPRPSLSPEVQTQRPNPSHSGQGETGGLIDCNGGRPSPLTFWRIMIESSAKGDRQQCRLQSGETLALARWGFECPDTHRGLAFQREKTLETDYG